MNEQKLKWLPNEFRLLRFTRISSYESDSKADAVGPHKTLQNYTLPIQNQANSFIY